MLLNEVARPLRTFPCWFVVVDVELHVPVCLRLPALSACVCVFVCVIAVARLSFVLATTSSFVQLYSCVSLFVTVRFGFLFSCLPIVFCSSFLFVFV